VSNGPLLDTDVLYIDTLAPYAPRSLANQQFVQAVEAAHASTSIFNVLELCGRASFRLPRQKVEALFYDLMRRPWLDVLYPRLITPLVDRFFDSFVQSTLDRILTRLDFQDALIANVAEEHNVEAIITWNTRHFIGKVRMPVLTPAEWLNTHIK